jgi:hypothetical protein
MPMTSVYPYCAPLPTNGNKIMLEVVPTSTSTANSIIYDIPTNAFTTVPSTDGDVSFNGGSPLNELCHRDQTLYAFPYGTGAKSYFATGTTPAGIWPNVISKGALAATRNYPAVAIVGTGLFAATPLLSTCTGC